MQFVYIHRNNLRQLYFFISLFQLHQSILSGRGIMPRLNRGSCRTQQSLGAIQGCQYNRCIPGMIAGSRVLLFIGILMFLIHNYQPQIAERQENRGTDSQNNIISFFRQLLLPDLYAFCIGKLRMINTQTISKHPLQTLCYLSGKSYFRQKIQYLFSLPDGFFNQVYIDFCFSAGSHTMQQAYIFGLKALHNPIMCRLLMFIQRIDGKSIPYNSVQSSYFLLIDFKDMLIYQTIKHCR